jgi:DNA-binding XRE family transcriptional regulator
MATNALYRSVQHLSSYSVKGGKKLSTACLEAIFLFIIEYSNIVARRQVFIATLLPMKKPEQRLAELMADKGWTQQDLASLLGVTRQSISLYVQGKRKITTIFAYALAYKAGINPEWLMDGKGKQQDSANKS